MSGMTYVSFFPNDWGGATRGFLSLEEEGLYIRCCAYMWDRGEPIPGNDSFAAKLLQVQVQKYIKVMAALVEKGKMIRGQGVVFNSRVMEDIENYRLEQSERSDRAKKGHQNRAMSAQKTVELHEEINRLRAHIERIEARSHADHPPTNLGGVPPHQPGGGSMGGSLGGTPLGHGEKHNKNNDENLHEQSTRVAIPLPLPLPVKKEEESPLPPKGGERGLAEQAFDDFWVAYPPCERKRGKGGARDAFIRIVTGTHRRGRRAKAIDIIAAVKRYGASRPDPEYIPLPTTWLNDGRFEDEPQPTQSTEAERGKTPDAYWWRGREELLRSLPIERWRKAIGTYANGIWSEPYLGPAPGNDGCLVPESLIVEMDLLRRYGPGSMPQH